MRNAVGVLLLVLKLAAGQATAQDVVNSQVPTANSQTGGSLQQDESRPLYPSRADFTQLIRTSRLGIGSSELGVDNNSQTGGSPQQDESRPLYPRRADFTQLIRNSRLGVARLRLPLDCSGKLRRGLAEARNESCARRRGSSELEVENAPPIEWPFRSSDGRLLVGGEIVGTFGESDNTAFFNYTDYEHNALRMMRLALAGQWRPMARVALVAEIRSEDLSRVDTHAAYVRIRPWESHAFDIQAGRIPPAFGAYGRRAYNADNPLIGYPLAYQYLTSLRSDAIPASVDDLLRMRGRGWQPSFPIGSTALSTGLPLISAFRWDTGVQARWSGTYVEVAGAVTSGTLSDPQFIDNNGGRQVSGRVQAKPLFGMVVGASAAHGDWLSDDVVDLLPEGARSRSYSQRALGLDAEYSRAHWLVRGEVVWSGWQMPFVQQTQTHRLDARGVWIEGRYRVSPRLFVAARTDRLDFSRISGTIFNGIPITWDAPVERVEVGLGWYLLRNLVGRVIVQRNWRDGGRVRSRTYVSGQLAYWF
jgi:hypothetical protein